MMSGRLISFLKIRLELFPEMFLGIFTLVSVAICSLKPFLSSAIHIRPISVFVNFGSVVLYHHCFGSRESPWPRTLIHTASICHRHPYPRTLISFYQTPSSRLTQHDPEDTRGRRHSALCSKAWRSNVSMRSGDLYIFELLTYVYAVFQRRASATF